MKKTIPLMLAAVLAMLLVAPPAVADHEEDCSLRIENSMLTPGVCSLVLRTKTKSYSSTRVRWSGYSCNQITTRWGSNCGRLCLRCLDWKEVCQPWICDPRYRLGESIQSLSVSTSTSTQIEWVAPDCVRRTVTTYSSACGTKTRTSLSVVSDSYCQGDRR